MKDHTELKSMRLAILGDVATQFIAQELSGVGRDYGFAFDIYEAGYEQITQQISEKSSAIYTFSPRAIIIIQSSEKLLDRFYHCALADRDLFAESELIRIKKLFSKLAEYAPSSSVLISNFVEIDDSVYGNYANKTRKSFIYHLRKINLGLMDEASSRHQVSIIDFNSIQNRIGRNVFFDPRMYVNASMVHSLECVPTIAKNICDLVAVTHGNFKKCVIVDLDNTLWGGGDW